MFIRSKKIRGLFVLWLFLLLFPSVGLAHENDQAGAHQAVIFYNEACGGCTVYLNEVLGPTLKEIGLTELIWKDYVNEKLNRSAYNDWSEQWGIPFDLRSHIMTFVDDKVVLAGHIPEEYIRYLLDQQNHDQFDKIIIYQDVMHGTVDNYKIWAFAGPVKEYSIDTSPAEYVEWFSQNKSSFANEVNAQPGTDWGFRKLFPLIIVSGFLDGINPCAFAVLLFFIAFLFTIRRTKARIFATGLVYIGAIYLAYFLIGLGLLQAVIISGAPHLMAKIGSGLVILLGLINILNYFFPRFPIKLKIPQFSKEILEKWMHKATLPAAFILGILVGLCTFPCSGGIYVAVVTLLAAQATYFKGLGYLLIYNLMFVVPLLIILFGAANKYVTDKMTTWEQSKAKSMRLWSGLAMIILGLVILIFFV